MIKLALVGAGRMGSVHFTNIISNPLVHCGYVIAESIEESTKLINDHKQNDTTFPSDNLQSILHDIDGVMICCSTPFHYKYIKQCLSAQKPVFVEKPICETLKEIDSLFQYSDEMNMKGIFVAYQRRFDPTIQQIYNKIYNNNYLLCNDENESKICSSNMYGIEKIISTSRDPTYPPIEYLANNSNGIYDSAVHDVDIICHLSKQFPSKVYCSSNAFYSPIKNLNDFDRLFINLEFESGILGMIDWCRHSGFGYDQQLQVLGYNGMLQMKNQSKDNMVQYNSSYGVVSSNPMNYFIDRYQDAYNNELNEFIETIRNPDKKIHSTYEQVRNVQIILQAVEYSAKIGQCVEIDYNIDANSLPL
eukprot:501006_1